MKTILNFAQQLISIESTKDNFVGMQALERCVREALNGSMVKSFSSNGVVSWLVSNQPTQEFKILLNAHLDVVAGHPEQFKPRIEGDKLYGRGAYDMKAAAAVMIEVFKEVAHTVNYPLGLQLVTDEEVGGFNGTKHQLDKGVQAKFVLGGEPTNFDIKYKAKGVLWLKVKSHGQSAHAAYPWNGTNAIWLLKPFLDQLEQAFPVATKETSNTTVNVSHIHSQNTTFNTVPDNCEVWLDIRYVAEDKDKILDQIKALLPPQTTLEVVMNEPSHKTDPHHACVRALIQTCTTHQLQPQLIGAHGSSDMRFFNTIGGEGIEFGPVGDGHHTDHEWVSLKSLATYRQVLKHWLLKQV